MSYDLIVLGKRGSAYEAAEVERLRKKARKLKGAKNNEISLIAPRKRAAQPLLAISLQCDDDDLALFWPALAAWAKKIGASIDDPQAGRAIDLDAPGEAPPMYGPLRLSTKKKRGPSLYARVGELIRSELEPAGFEAVGKFTALRHVRGGLWHGINFQKGSSYASGCLVLNVYLCFSEKLARDGFMEGCKRIEDPRSTLNGWFDTRGEQMEAGIEKLRTALRKQALPRLAKFPDIASVVAAVEKKRYPQYEIIGYCPEETMPDLYLRLGDSDKAAAGIEKALAKAPFESFDVASAESQARDLEALRSLLERLRAAPPSDTQALPRCAERLRQFEASHARTLAKEAEAAAKKATRKKSGTR